MKSIALLILAITCVYLIIWGLLKRERLYTPSLWMAFVILIILMPQAISLLNDETLPPLGYEKTLFMIILSMILTHIGFNRRCRPLMLFEKMNDRSMLASSGIFLSIIGIFFWWKISGLSEDFTSGQWSGLSTIYNFFAQMFLIGHVLLLLSLCKKITWPSLSVYIIDTLLILDRIFISSRRSTAAFFLLTTLLVLWQRKGIIIPRILLLILLVAGALFVHSIGEYRDITTSGGGYNSILTGRDVNYGDIFSIDYLSNLEDSFHSKAPELSAAVYSISNIDYSNSYDFGMRYWNSLIHNFFPAQVFSANLKRSLMFHVTREEFFVHEVGTGTSGLGVVGAFSSFSYFGVFEFMIFALVLRKLLNGADHSDASLLLYAYLLFCFLQGISHSLTRVFTGAVYVIFVVFITSRFCLLWSKIWGRPYCGLPDAHCENLIAYPRSKSFVKEPVNLYVLD